MRKFGLILFVLVIISLSACTQGPEQAAEKFLEASMNMDGNQVIEYTCLSERETMQTLGLYESAFSLVGQLLPQLFGLDLDIPFEIDTSDVHYVAVSNNGQTASVRVTGDVRYSVMAFADVIDVDETWRMVLEDGKWKWCGY